MEPMDFKTGLFGFKRKQVLTYIDRTCADFQQQLAEKEANHGRELAVLRQESEDKIRTHQHALSVQLEENDRLEQQLSIVAKSLEEKFTLLEAEQNKTNALQQQMQEVQQQNQLLQNQLVAAKQGEETAREALSEYQHRLAEKDGFIARQTLEVTRLQDHVSRLEEDFSSIREDANQSTAMVNCLNLLHGRNRALTQKVAKLEAQLEDARTGGVIEKYTRSANDKQETVRTTETLFATVRKEIQDALDSISLKIEAGSIEESEDGNYFVDMAKL